MAEGFLKIVSLMTPKRRCIQFSLRLLLIFTSIVAISLGVLSYRNAVQQRRIAAIREMGGDASLEARGPIWLRRLLGERFFERVVGAEFHGSKVTDETLAVVAGFADLKGLSVINATITDKGIEQLRAMRHLEVLYLENVPITDEGLMHLRNVPSLKELRIAIPTTGATDEGVKKLQRVSPTLTVVDGVFL